MQDGVTQRTEKTDLDVLRITQKWLLACAHKYPCIDWQLGN